MTATANHKLRQFLGLADDDEVPELDGVGIRRISRDAGRKAAGTLHSDEDQDDRIYEVADSWGVRLIEILDETNVPGDTPLDLRPYGDAITRMERGELRAIIFAYDDRVDRDVVIHQQAVGRIDAQDGILLAGNQAITHKTEEAWTYSTLKSVLNESQKRKIRERVHTNVEKAVADGRVPYPSVTLGLELYGPNNHVRPVTDTQTLNVVREAFLKRSGGATIDEVRAYLADHGYVRTYQAVRRMLSSPLYIGEIRYGGKERANGTITPRYVKTGLFEPIVDPDVWQRVQDMRVIAGRYSKSERLLARLGILLCATCGARMTVMTRKVNGVEYAYYRCGRGRVNDCPAPVTISAPAIEQYVLAAASREVEYIVEHESSQQEAREAVAIAEAAARHVDDLEGKYMDLGPGKHPGALAKRNQARAEAHAKKVHADKLVARQTEDWLGAAAILADDSPAAIPAKRAILEPLMAGRVTVRRGTRGGRGGGGRIDDRVTIARRHPLRAPTA